MGELNAHRLAQAAGLAGEPPSPRPFAAEVAAAAQRAAAEADALLVRGAGSRALGGDREAAAGGPRAEPPSSGGAFSARTATGDTASSANRPPSASGALPSDSARRAGPPPPILRRKHLTSRASGWRSPVVYVALRAGAPGSKPTPWGISGTPAASATRPARHGRPSPRPGSFKLLSLRAIRRCWTRVLCRPSRLPCAGRRDASPRPSPWLKRLSSSVLCHRRVPFFSRKLPRL